MPIVFAAVTAHPPLLIPTIGKDKLVVVEKTKTSLERLEQELYTSKPSLILIISPHTGLYPDAFSINANTKFQSSFQEFGDLVTKREWKGSPELAAAISHHAKKQHVHVQLSSNDQLDHGAAVPLFYLTAHLQDISVLPVGYSTLPAKDHLAFGHVIKDALHETHHRVAVIASGDLSHSEHEVDGVHIFDKACMDALKGDESALLALEPHLEGVQECGYRSALIMKGILGNLNHHFETYSYERPLGVGYLVGNFHV